MKQEIFKCLVISGSMLLVACAAPEKEQNNSATRIPSNEALVEFERPPANKIDPTIKGNVIMLNPILDRSYTENEQTERTSSLNKVVISGSTHTFAPTGHENAKNLNIWSANVKRFGSGTELSYMRYGYTKTGGASPAYIFAHGHATGNNMPKTGTAVYNGHATHISVGEISRAPATFDVDYGEKRLFGVITPHSGERVTLHAVISGDRFQGSNWLDDKNTLMQTNGYFYGPKAEELGGTYRSSGGSINGSFGAIKK